MTKFAALNETITKITEAIQTYVSSFENDMSESEKHAVKCILDATSQLPRNYTKSRHVIHHKFYNVSYLIEAFIWDHPMNFNDVESIMMFMNKNMKIFNIRNSIRVPFDIELNVIVPTIDCDVYWHSDCKQEGVRKLILIHDLRRVS